MRTYFINIVISLFILFVSIGTPAMAEDTLCARVQIEIRQEVTLERQAFDAHMRINNGLSHITLENVQVDVNFQDEGGDPVLASSDPNNTDALFFIRVDSMNNISNVDGSGTVDPSTSADIHWLIIPAPDSSNGLELGTLYYVGATLSYTIGGEEHITEVSPDYIFVKPMPELALDYFLPTQVYGDDAFTPEIEPTIPFFLGVLVHNNGSGTARNMKIDSAQPKIVENEQGLLIDFVIEGSEVNGYPFSPSLLANFGDIAPADAGTARWIMSASLSGEFVEFSATFSHSDELGGELTSLIDTVETHFLLRDVLVDLNGRDSIRDFLTKDHALYSVYESDNLISSVADQSAFSSMILQEQTEEEAIYSLTVPTTAGFMYLQFPDPYDGSMVIKEILRSDGKIIQPDNGWLSKTRSEGAEWNYYFNLFDANTTNSYTVIFAHEAGDPQAPVLQVIPDRTRVEGEQLSFIVEASDPDGDIPEISVDRLPPLATFIDQGDGTAIFDWTPAVGQAGIYDITFTASDGFLTSARDTKITIYSHLDQDGDDLPDTLEDTMCTHSNNPDSDNDGLKDGVEDANHNGIVDEGETNPCDDDSDNDGYKDGVEVEAGTDPLDSDSYPQVDIVVQLKAGFNLLAIPADVSLLSSLWADWMPVIGDATQIEKVLVYDYETGSFLTFVPGEVPADEYILTGGEALIVYAKTGKSVTFTSQVCRVPALQAGFNLIGITCPYEGYSAFDFLNEQGSDSVSSIQSYSTELGHFETALFGLEGSPIGVDFPILLGKGYFVIMKE